MPYYTNDQWNAMSEEARAAHIEAVTGALEEQQDNPLTAVSIRAASIKIRSRVVTAGEQWNWLNFVSSLFGKNK